MTVGQKVIVGQRQAVYDGQKVIVMEVIMSVPPATEPSAKSSSSIAPDGCAGNNALCSALRLDLNSSFFHALITSK